MIAQAYTKKIFLNLDDRHLGVRGEPSTESVYQQLRMITRRSRWRTGKAPIILLVVEKDGDHKELRCGNARIGTNHLLRISRPATAWFEVKDR